MKAKNKLEAAAKRRVRAARLLQSGKKPAEVAVLVGAPLSLEKMSYDADRGTVVYRSRMHKSRKRNFQFMAGAQWLKVLSRHIPDRFEHLVRYAGWYSNRSRGKRAAGNGDTDTVVMERTPEDARHARSAWVRLIHKVYEVDPLECPRRRCPMKVIALIDNRDVIRKILGLRAPAKPQPPPGRGRPPPIEPESNVLTYHPVPDIA